ncbi:MAG: tetratricopeptide repeat protein [Planctomycetota bacterium]
MRRTTRGGIVAAATLVVGSLGLGACASSPKGPRNLDPDKAMGRLEDMYAMTPEGARYEQYRMGAKGKDRVSRATLRKQAEEMSFLYPSHIPARFMAGLLAYEFDDPARASQHFDHVLHIAGSHPDAAVIRSRIALDDGNSAYALHMLEEQIQLRPDHAGLREAQAAAWFLAGDTAQARTSLDAAERLGSPGWRIAYNRGLLAEEDGDAGSAIEQYRLAAGLAPYHQPSRHRLRALEAGGLGLAATVDIPGTPAQPVDGMASMQPTDDGSLWIEVPVKARPELVDPSGPFCSGCVDAGTPATTFPAPAGDDGLGSPPSGSLPATSLPTETMPEPVVPAAKDEGPPIPDARSLGLDE